MATKESRRPAKILAIDVGGTKVKYLASGETEPRKMASGRELSPAKMVEEIRDSTKDWRYSAVSIGIPSRVGPNGPASEPGNLGSGWVGFDYAAAFECPVRIVNDAAMQALGSYDGGRMLFLGLGTGVGSVLVRPATDAGASPLLSAWVAGRLTTVPKDQPACVARVRSRRAASEPKRTRRVSQPGNAPPPKSAVDGDRW
jgi:hypothetical protein